MTFDSYSADDRSESVPLFAWARVTQLAAALLVVLVMSRSQMLELIRDPFEIFPDSPYTPASTGPGTMLVLNTLCLLPAALVLLRRAFDRHYRPPAGGALLMFVALGVLAMVSTLWASDRFLAIIAGSTLVAAAAIAWAASQLFRSWARFRLLAAAFVGILAVYAAQGIFYRTIDLPELQRNVETSKDNILRERGFEPGSFQAEQFLRRITNGEMVGFGSSPNTYAAQIVMMSVVAAGLLAEGIRRKRDPILLTSLMAVIVVALWMSKYSHSNTALATPVIACGLFALGVVMGPLLAGRRKAAFVVGLAIVLLGIGAVVGHGLYHHGLPSASLNFRWRYWVGSYQMVLDHPWRGTGYANFGESYLQHRLPAAAEEIRDPHNLLVRFATELGLPGLAICLAWLVGCAWGVTRPVEAELVPRRRGLALGPIAFAGLVGVAMLINVIATIDFASNSAFVIIELFKRLMFAGVLVVFGALALIQGRTQATPDDEPAPWALLGCTCALAVFLLHNIIDFSFFEPSALMQFAPLLGAVIGMRSASTAGSNTPTLATAADMGHSKATQTNWPPARLAGLGGLAVVVVALLFGTGMLTVPVLAAESRSRQADEYLRTARVGENQYRERYAASAATYLEAARIVPYNVDYLFRAGRALAIGAVNFDDVRQALDHAVAVNPMHLKSRLERARLELKLASSGIPGSNLPLAERLLAEAVRLNPIDVDIRTDYAAALEMQGKFAEAAEQLQRVLTDNDLLDPTEPKRLQPQELAARVSRLGSLRERIETAGGAATRQAPR